MGYVFIFLMGFGFSVMGGVTIIAYMNFLPAGLSWGEYFTFIASRMECYFLPIGIIIMAIVLARFPNNTNRGS
ncbi:MAG: hypothetical protein ACQEWU_17385 [Bacillota bacterium]|uniref:Uncharacterized protein n=1 Tax=Virgibacillus salarius TaxID=447199 RepID=A0A941ICR1_9BACI|nr:MULTISPECIES: hypothetical protein [Bacillaceae]NAZ10352.1 hypothetical protein [Agaribacter marinus]MBR7797642.1 hypothetical protein [Virgibacillus salarius]MCC2251674.1 hypothetical protein [Virgibacillus sp. AGTR]MDY7045418.1 hypothetical protein [Virgibacillus sp. M23]QRZ16525.1 hypothetical protein JUJ52_11955 [Virgibacillus sp. AGTR]